MATKSQDKNANNKPSSGIPASEIFPILAHNRRRYLLHYLSQKVGAVSLGELAEQLAIWEGKPTKDQYERILTSFHHIHLPKLAEVGLITYDLDRERVQLLEAATSIKPYLELSVKDDFR